MTHGAVLQNETGLPNWNRPLLIATTIKFFIKKSRKKEDTFRIRANGFFSGNRLLVKNINKT
jgi:hypothetical protein